MKLTTSILAIAIMTGAAGAQNPDAIDNARSMAKSLQQKQANDSNAALDVAGVPAKPDPAKPAPAQAAKSAPVKSVPATAQATKPGAVSGAPTLAAKSPATQSAKAPAPAPKKIKTAAVAKKPVKAHPVIAAKEPADAKKPADPFTAKAGIDAKNREAKSEDAAKLKPEAKKWAMTGKRDPFFSPVVQQASGSGCSTGKKCLEIGQINLRGVVKSEAGFIAVVTNSANKAYFLHESDPVFNGYVIRITGDSVVFQETVQDKLGKPLTREVVKRLFTPAV
jgi:Tfp pilus assembly protein PilP